jgi:hypothetical protein
MRATDAAAIEVYCTTHKPLSRILLPRETLPIGLRGRVKSIASARHANAIRKKEALDLPKATFFDWKSPMFCRYPSDRALLCLLLGSFLTRVTIAGVVRPRHNPRQHLFYRAPTTT